MTIARNATRQLSKSYDEERGPGRALFLMAEPVHGSAIERQVNGSIRKRPSSKRGDVTFLCLHSTDDAKDSAMKTGIVLPEHYVKGLYSIGRNLEFTDCTGKIQIEVVKSIAAQV